MATVDAAGWKAQELKTARKKKRRDRRDFERHKRGSLHKSLLPDTVGWSPIDRKGRGAARQTHRTLLLISFVSRGKKRKPSPDKHNGDKK